MIFIISPESSLDVESAAKAVWVNEGGQFPPNESANELEALADKEDCISSYPPFSEKEGGEGLLATSEVV